VTSGAVHYWEAEATALPPCSTPEPQRRESGVGGTISFQQGEPVLGDTIRVDGLGVYRRCYFRQAPNAGTVTSGAVNYWEAEAAGLPPCSG
jgi:hypothetical protein